MRKFTIEYVGFRDVFAKSEEEARAHAFDCTLSILESISVNNIDEEEDIEFCERCELQESECKCKEESLE